MLLKLNGKATKLQASDRITLGDGNSLFLERRGKRMVFSENGDDSISLDGVKDVELCFLRIAQLLAASHGLLLVSHKKCTGSKKYKFWDC